MNSLLSSVKKLPWLASRFLKNERKYLRRYDVPLRTLIKLWTNGFFSYGGVLYDCDRLDLYLSDVDEHRTIGINGAMGTVLRNKFVTKRFLEDSFGDHLPRTYGLVRHGRFHPTASDATSLLELLNEVGAVVCKPIAAGRGKDVFVVERADELRINGEPATGGEVRELASELSDHLVVEHVRQHAFESSVFPESLNTMRVLTMIDPDSGDPFIGASVHRFGTATSAPTDNWSAGGTVAPIDPDTGGLSGPLAASGNTKEWLTCHPETGTPVDGETVPNWGRVRELVLSAADELSAILPYIGWDIAIAEDGTPMVIEANRATDVDLLQFHEPLLADPRRRRFYEYHGIV